MNFPSLLEKLPSTGLFRTGDILAGQKKPQVVRRQLDRWVKSGKIIRLRREVYLLNKPYRDSHPHPFLTANLLRRSSYVSLQSALSYYGMIPEHVPVVTSVTGGRPEEVHTLLGKFEFRHVLSRNFFGFGEKEVAVNQTAWIATPEKALADLLYLTPRSDQADYLDGLRLDVPSSFDKEALMNAAGIMRSSKVRRGVAVLLKLWEKPADHETIID